jgi:multifunctional beta-oxidation protein
MHEHMNMLLTRSQESSGQSEHAKIIEETIKKEGKPTEFKYEERDVILYNLGVGAKRTDLKYVL